MPEEHKEKEWLGCQAWLSLSCACAEASAAMKMLGSYYADIIGCAVDEALEQIRDAYLDDEKLNSLYEEIERLATYDENHLLNTVKAKRKAFSIRELSLTSQQMILFRQRARQAVYTCQAPRRIT